MHHAVPVGIIQRQGSLSGDPHGVRERELLLALKSTP
jgi:hypothetical protein